MAPSALGQGHAIGTPAGLVLCLCQRTGQMKGQVAVLQKALGRRLEVDLHNRDGREAALREAFNARGVHVRNAVES